MFSMYRDHFSVAWSCLIPGQVIPRVGARTIDQRIFVFASNASSTRSLTFSWKARSLVRFVWNDRAAKINLAVLVPFDVVSSRSSHASGCSLFIKYSLGKLFPTRFEFRAFSRRDSLSLTRESNLVGSPSTDAN